MKLSLEEVTVEYFGSFAEPQTLDLMKLQYGAHLIKGKNLVDKSLGANDAGKSTLINAISWCWWGKTGRNLKASDIKPWNGEGKPRVATRVKIDDRRHIIARVAPNYTTIDGKEVGQDEIERLLRLSFVVGNQTVIFGQFGDLFFDLPNRDKLGLLSEVMELGKWDVWSQRASERTRERESEVTRLTGKILALESGIARTRAMLVDSRRDAELWGEQQASGIAMLKKDRKRLAVELEEATKARDKAIRIGVTGAEKLGGAQGDYQAAKTKLDILEKEQARNLERANLLLRQVKEVDKEIREMGDAANCPTCGQSLKGTDRAKHRKKLVEKRDKLAKEHEAIPTIKGSAQYEALKLQLTEAHGHMVTYQAKVDERRREIETATRKVIELELKVKAATVKISERTDDTNPHLAQIKRLKGQLQEQKADLADAKDLAAKAERQAARSRYWIKGFKEIRLLVVDEILQDLEMVTNSILEDMGLPGWEVKYDVERETKSGSVQTGLTIGIMSPRNSKPVKWEVWGGGAGQRLRLAGALALSEVLLQRAGVELDFEILDEPTRHMSDEGVADLCEMLANRGEVLGRRILYVDHMAYESSAFASTITVTKTKEGSKLRHS